MEPRGGERIWAVTASLSESQSTVQIGGDHLLQSGRGLYTTQLCPIRKTKGGYIPNPLPPGVSQDKACYFCSGQRREKKKKHIRRLCTRCSRLPGCGTLASWESDVQPSLQTPRRLLWTRSFCLSFCRTGITKHNSGCFNFL